MEETKIINVNDKASSFEFGKAGNRFKIYFNAKEDALQLIEDCKAIQDKKNELIGVD
uniref:Uncharacterized protein n=1 Tax=viral metagenome TaxID=1070528 RepID=A0A6H1ZYF4_9ZZZZ